MFSKHRDFRPGFVLWSLYDLHPLLKFWSMIVISACWCATPRSPRAAVDRVGILLDLWRDFVSGVRDYRDWMAGEFKVCVVGGSRVGKSSHINAHLGLRVWQPKYIITPTGPKGPEGVIISDNVLFFCLFIGLSPYHTRTRVASHACGGWAVWCGGCALLSPPHLSHVWRLVAPKLLSFDKSALYISCSPFNSASIRYFFSKKFFLPQLFSP